MSKLVFACLTATSVVVLAGCQTSGGQREPDPDCVFPQTQARAPVWVCRQGTGPEGAAIWDVGSYQKTAAGVAFQQDQAALNGRSRLVQQMRSVVTSGLKQAIETTGAGKSETVDQLASSTAKLISSETLIGSRVFRTAYAPDGTAYVLVGIDEAGARRVIDTAVKTSQNNDRAQWQTVQSARLQVDLSAEIYKLGAQGLK